MRTTHRRDWHSISFNTHRGHASLVSLLLHFSWSSCVSSDKHDRLVKVEPRTEAPNACLVPNWRLLRRTELSAGPGV